MTRSYLRSNRHFCVLLLLLLGAFALRMYRLDAVSLRGDESFTVLFVLKPFGQMWKEILTVEPNPPLLYLLLRGWVGVAGAGEFATRYFSVFWGVLCVALLYRLTLEFFRLSSAPRRAVALAAALLIALNPYQLWHSQDVRNYTMWPALSLLALIFFWQWRNAHKTGASVRMRTIIPFVLAELAALYTHYYEVFVLVALNLYVLVFLLRRWKDLKRRGLFSLQSPLVQWVSAQVVLAALYLPFPLLLSNRVSSYGEGSGKQGVMLWDIWQRTVSVFMVGESLDETIRSFLWIPLVLALVLCLWLLWRRERRGMFILLWAGIPTLAIFGLNLFRPLFLERYLNGIAPVYYLLLAYGLAVAWTSRLRYVAVLAGAALLVVSALALGNYFYNPAFAKAPDWRGVARAIDGGRQDGDIIVQNFPETSLLYYEGGHLPLVVYPEEFLPGKGMVPALEKLNGKYRRVWFIPAAQDFWDPNHAVENYLDAHDELLSEQNIGTMRLELYSTPAQFTRTMQPASAQVGNFFTLAGYRVARQESGWHLVLYWRVRKTPPVNMSVFIEFVDNQSVPPRILSSLERPPLNGALPTGAWREGELIVDSYDLLAGGAATALRVGMYNPTNSKRLPVIAPNLPAADYYEISP